MRKQRRLKLALNKFHGSIVCLLETHVKQDKFLPICSYILPGWTCFVNYDYGLLGRIRVLHDPTIRMQIFSASAQAIHCHTFSLVHKKYFLLSVIYGANANMNRRALWGELQSIKELMPEVPWLLCGDFNSELHMLERSDYYEGMPCS